MLVEEHGREPREQIPAEQLVGSGVSSGRRRRRLAGVGLRRRRPRRRRLLVHSIGGGDFAEQDLDSARTFAAAARDAGVRRIVYLGGLVPHENLSEHLERRADVGDALGDSGVDLVWLRAAVILGGGSTSYELVQHIADRVPVIPLPTWMNHPVAPIAVADVLHHLAACADPDLVPPGAYDIAHDERPTYSQLIKAYAADAGLRRWWLPFPPVPPELIATVASWLTPLPHELTADLTMSLPNSMDSQDRRIRDLVPDPDGGLVTVADALTRSRGSNGQGGVSRRATPGPPGCSTRPGGPGPGGATSWRCGSTRPGAPSPAGTRRPSRWRSAPRAPAWASAAWSSSAVKLASGWPWSATSR